MRSNRSDSTRSTGHWHGRVCNALLCSALGLSGCGGGGSDPPTGAEVLTGTATNAAAAQAPTQPGMSAQAPESTTARTRRPARSYNRKGVTTITARPDGKAIAVAHADGRIRILDPVDATETKLLKRPDSAAPAGLMYSGDSRYVISAGRDSVARGWNVDTGEQVFTLNGHEHPLRTAAVSADGGLIATAGEETRVLLWSAKTGRLLHARGGHTTFVNALAFSPNGQRLASGDASGRILVWDAASRRLLHRLLGHADELNALAFSAEGTLLASAGEDGKVLLWDVTTGRQVYACSGQQAPVRGLAFDRAGSRLAGGAADGHVLVWDMATRTLTLDLVRSDAGVNAVAFAQDDGASLLAGNEANEVWAWRLPRRP